MRKQGRARDKWNRNSALYDLFTFMEVRGKNAEVRAEMLKETRGRILEVGIGTGHSVAFFPEGSEVVGIDISEKMLCKAKAKTEAQKGRPALLNMDAEKMGFKDNSFDTVVSTCVFCSVPDPVEGLSEIKRVLKPDGRLLMYEHMISRNPLLALMLNAMNPFVSRIMGSNVNRDTVGNIVKAGLRVTREMNVRFFDIFRRIDATH